MTIHGSMLLLLLSLLLDLLVHEVMLLLGLFSRVFIGLLPLTLSVPSLVILIVSRLLILLELSVLRGSAHDQIRGALDGRPCHFFVGPRDGVLGHVVQVCGPGLTVGCGLLSVGIGTSLLPCLLRS